MSDNQDNDILRDSTANTVVSFREVQKTNTGPIESGPLDVFSDGVIGGFVDWESVEQFRCELHTGSD